MHVIYVVKFINIMLFVIFFFFVIFFNYLFTSADSIDVTSLIPDIDYWFLLLFFPDQPGQSFVNFIDHEKPTFILLIFLIDFYF